MAHAVEEPDYVVIDRIDKVEIRRYEMTIVAVTKLRDSGQTTAGFRRLASYIFGENDGKQQIAMTAPVQETLDAEHPELAFTMPRGYSMEGLPNPDNSDVLLAEVPARTVAVIGFSGWATPGRVDQYTEQLRKVIDARNFEVVGSPSLNQYNPPWTLPFLRRNEIMQEIMQPGYLEYAGSLTQPSAAQVGSF